jgi:hypothetical protein
MRALNAIVIDLEERNSDDLKDIFHVLVGHEGKGIGSRFMGDKGDGTSAYLVVWLENDNVSAWEEVQFQLRHATIEIQSEEQLA